MRLDLFLKVSRLVKSRSVAQELTAAARDWNMRIERFPSRTDASATILRISEIRPVGAKA